ncbi:MAG: hypothetical protein ACE15F_06190 [bacterium]
MAANPSLSVLIWSALADSADFFIILLAVAGGMFWIPSRIMRPLPPLLLSTVLTCGLFLVIPASVPFAGAPLFILLWAVTLPFVFFPVIHPRFIRVEIRKATGRSPFFGRSMDGIILITFGISVWMLMRAPLAGQPLPWEPVLTGNIILIAFYLIYQIAPWQFLPLRTPKDIGKVLLYISAGCLVLRLSFWSYALFNAAVKERPGSFRVKGIVYATEMTQGWRFPRLRILIDRYWYYPVSPGRMANPYPVVRDPVLLGEGIQKCEAFRRSLLAAENGEKTAAELIIDSLLSFQQLAEPRLEGHVSLSAFRLERDALLSQLSGIDAFLRGEELFNAFAGYWHGEWDGRPVAHYWKMVEHFDPPLEAPGAYPARMLARQYCWIGDGFGWNILATIPGAEDENGNPAPMNVILGIVYHVQDQNPAEITQFRPHVGLYADPGKLIWITGEEVFLEEVKRDRPHGEERYTITGYRYAIENKQITNKGPGFQAVYSRNPEDQHSFFTFDIPLQVQ